MEQNDKSRIYARRKEEKIALWRITWRKVKIILASRHDIFNRVTSYVIYHRVYDQQLAVGYRYNIYQRSVH